MLPLSRERLIQEAADHIVAWFLVAVALIPAVLVGDLAFIGWLAVSANADGKLHWFGLWDWIEYLGLMAAFSVPFMILFWVLAVPLVAFRRWIVKRKFPFVRAGYVAVAMYGPVLLGIYYWYSNADGSGYLMWAALYEIIAAAATSIFVLLVERSVLGQRLRVG